MSSLTEQITQANDIKCCLWVDCGARFFEFKDLFDHLKEMHINAQPPNLPRDCRWGDRCNYQTNEKKHIISHLRSHLDWRPYSCDICNSKFKHEHEIRRHKDRLHGSNNTNNSTSPNNQLTPPLMNSNQSSNQSPIHTDLCTNALTPEMDHGTDKVLVQLIEYGLGYKNSIQVDEAFKNQLSSIALPLNVIDIPQPQLRRYIIDSFHQALMLSVTTANANSYSQMNQSSISPNLFDPTSYLNNSQPLINGYNDPGMGYNNNFGFGFGVNEHLQQNLQSQEQPLFNFPTPPNSNNNYNGYGYQSQDFMKQDPMGLNYYDNNLMNINSMSVQNSRSITPPGNGIKAESTSPTLTTPGFRTRGIPPEEIYTLSRSIESNGVKKESSDSSPSNPKGNILSSIMPNVMSFLKFPTIIPPKEDNMNSRNRSMPPSPQPSRSRSNSPLRSGPKDSPNSVEREDYDHIYLSPTSKNEKAIDTNLPIIRQDDGSFDVYKPKFVTPFDFQRSPSKKGNMPLSPDEYLTLSLSKLKI